MNDLKGPSTLWFPADSSKNQARLKWSIQCILLALFPLELLWTLRTTISRLWAYEGFGYYGQQPWSYMLALAFITLIPGLMLITLRLTPGILVTWMLNVFVYVPSQLAPVFATGAKYSEFVYFQVTLFVGFALMIAIASFDLDCFPGIRISAIVFWGLLLAFSALICLLTVAHFGLPHGIPGLANVYSTRNEFAAKSATALPGFAYLFSWYFKVVNPFLMTYGLVRRSIIAFCTGFIGQLFAYSYTGHKAVLFSSVLILALYLATICDGAMVGFLFTLGPTVLVLLATAYDILADSVWGVSLFVRRLFFVPGVLTGYYWEFFRFGEKTHTFGSIGGLFGGYPYDLPVVNLIGYVYYRNENVSANANVWADAFASFGYLGVILYSVILGVILMLFNSAVHRVGWRTTVVFVGVVAYSWANSALFTSLLTHGGILALLLLAFYPKDRSRELSPV